RRILMEPGGGNGIDLQSVEGDRTKYAVEIGRKQRLEDLPQPVIMERCSREAGLEQRDHATFLQACPYLVERMMAIENRQQEGLHTTATREDMRRVRRTEGINKRGYVELADHSEHQRQVGHGTDLLNGNRHEAPFLQVCREGVS